MDDKNVFGMEEWKTRFLETRQPPLKFKIALEHYFTEGEGEWKERCGGYLKLRLRPAVDALIAGNETVKLRQLLRTGWFTRRIVDEAIDRASGQNRTEIVTMLLKWKYEAEDTEGGANPYRGRNECGVGEEDCRGRKTAEPPESVQQVKKRVCDNIWQISILSVSGIYPFFRTFLCGLDFISTGKQKEKEKFQKIALEGMRVYYQEEDLMECFTRDYREVEHVLLHMMMHHLFFHTIMEPEENLRVWNLACDMAAENLIHMIKDRSESGKIGKKMEIRPEVLYRELLGQALTERALAEKEHQYGRDDHCFWNKTEKKKLTEYVERQWRGLRKHQGAGLGGGFGGTGGKGSRDMEVLDIHKKGKAEFRHFLRQFAVGGEEVQMDMESIDYIPYLYGLNQYGNMPLVEHLEYSEVRKLQELVIAIDTSGSCTADTVRRFMEEVYGILSARENFFHKMNVYILQCDFMVQHAVHITCEQEWKDYLKHLVIYGRSDTDFRPVFRYAEELQKQKKLKNLKGLLYFTDGDGIYPRKATAYKTAFIFYHRKCEPRKVPEWAWQFELEDI